MFEHVLVISRDSSVFMFSNALPVHHVHAFLSCWGPVAYLHDGCKMPSCCFGQIVVMTYSVCVLNRCSVLSVLYMKLA